MAGTRHPMASQTDKPRKFEPKLMRPKSCYNCEHAESYRFSDYHSILYRCEYFNGHELGNSPTLQVCSWHSSKGITFI